MDTAGNWEDGQGEDVEKLIKQEQLREAKARAEKAREEARHERAKQAKTEAEAEKIRKEAGSTFWKNVKEGVLTVGSAIAVASAALVFYEKIKK